MDQLLAFSDLGSKLTLLWEAQRDGRISPFWGECPGAIQSLVLTPDFHLGPGIPVGTVVDARGFILPQAIGNDIGCGMRLVATDLPRDELLAHSKALKGRLREIFFQGKRDIPMSPRQRRSLLREGLVGVLDTHQDNCGKGIWRYYDPAEQRAALSRVHAHGLLPTNDIFAFDAFAAASGAADGRDAQIGSVGGGNHFVEIQGVDEIFHRGCGWHWKLCQGSVAIMIHTGSVGLGHVVGSHFAERARNIYPRSMPKPAHGFFPIPTQGPHEGQARAYLSAMGNAANFAMASRLFLELMTLRALSEVVGRRLEGRLVYDAPHNLIWEPGVEHEHLHRKGASPASGPGSDPFGFGEPVLIPGSMGSCSFLLEGMGMTDALSSSPHGAGRAMSRGASGHDLDDTALAGVNVVCPIDPDSPNVRGRRDILDKYYQKLREEAPGAYKSIAPVVRTVIDAGIAQPVARLSPLLTVKG